MDVALWMSGSASTARNECDSIAVPMPGKTVTVPGDEVRVTKGAFTFSSHITRHSSLAAVAIDGGNLAL